MLPTTIKEVEKQGFKGNDISLYESLFIYGLIWKPTEIEGEYLFIYGVSIDETCEFVGFDWACFSYKDWEKLFEEGTWVDLKAIENFTGMPIDEIKSGFPDTIDILIGYYGIENIFGSGWVPFKIEGNKNV